MKRFLFAVAFCAVLLALTACSSKLTEDNLQKIHSGMTTNEVKATLGAPTNAQSSVFLGSTCTIYTYHTDKSDVQISFLNNKVLSTEGDFK